MGINFEKISNVISSEFDIDLMDIYREVEGFVERQEIYSNISCNIEIVQSDVSNPTALDVVPIITSIRIHMPNWVDIRNNDYIVAKRMSNNRQILQVYRGVCGEPATWQARKSVNMTMSTIEDENAPVTPPPPISQSEITINFLDTSDDQELNPSIVKVVEQGTPYIVQPLTLEGFSLEQAFLDNEQVETGVVTIENPQESGHVVTFKYQKLAQASSFRLLVDGYYTKDDGSFGRGLHLYSSTPIISMTENNGIYTIHTNTNVIDHEEIGDIELEIGSKLKTNFGDWFKIITELVKLLNGQYTFDVETYTPTQAEQQAYVTHWYD